MRARTARPNPRPRPRRLALAAAAGAVLVAGTAAASAVGGQAEPEPPGAVAELRREVAAMRADGLPADHPKVRMLEREIEALVAGATATTVPDPGLSRGSGGSGGNGGARGEAAGRAATPAEAAELADDLAAEQSAEAGAVECEPVPHVLAAGEVAGAVSCVSVPQPDGTSRYLAVQPDGTVHVVRFGHDGRVSRLDDVRLPDGAAGEEDVALLPDEDGSVSVRSGDVEVGRLDVG